jgi:hypothetical protein
MEIKEQLRQDEELIVKVFQLERFLRKHKWKLIIGGALVVGGGIGYQIYSWIQARRLEEANKLLYKIETQVGLSQQQRRELERELGKLAPKLEELELLKSSNPADWKRVQDPILKQIAQYKLAVHSGRIEQLEGYLYNPQYSLLKGQVRFLLIYLYLKEGEREKGVKLYNEIKDPGIRSAAKLLLHQGLLISNRGKGESRE